MSLSIFITHSASSLNVEKRYVEDTKICNLKDKLYMVSGTAPNFQELHLMRGEQFISVLAPDDATLKECGVFQGARIHIMDFDPNNNIVQLNDLSNVEKYEMSDETYGALNNTFRNFKETHLKEHISDVEKKKAEAKSIFDAQEVIEKEQSQNMKVNMRCELGTDELPRRGEILFVGNVSFSDGIWIGIKLDEPSGKHNGTVQDVNYFSCRDKYGVMVRPSKVKVGDYPEIDEFAEL